MSIPGSLGERLERRALCNIDIVANKPPKSEGFSREPPKKKQARRGLEKKEEIGWCVHYQKYAAPEIRAVSQIT